MAEEKKPKIDLKARLGKASAGTPAPGTAGVPVPIPAPSFGSKPPPAIPPPVLPGTPVGPPPPFAGGGAIDPTNPLAAVAAPYRPPAPPEPPRPQRIEVDEAAVQQARKASAKQGLAIAGVAAVVALGVGYIIGQASTEGAGRKKSAADAAELAVDVGKAKDSLNKLADRLEDGRTKLTKDRKFPAELANELGGINVDFDGSKLAGRRFSGFSPETTTALTEFITDVEALKDRKNVVKGLLGKLQKPLTEQFAAPPGQTTINYVVVVDRDPAGNPSGLLAALTTPITFTPPKVDLPGEYTFRDPLGQGNAKLPAYKGGDISNKPAAMYVAPKTFNAVCPSETQGQTAQLAAQLGNMIREIKGEQQQQQADVVMADTKPGLVERAIKLQDSLQKVK